MPTQQDSPQTAHGAKPRLARRLATIRPGIRWHTSRVWTELVLRRAFAALGPETVVVAPRILRGVERMSLGARCAIYEGAWLDCESDHDGRLVLGDDNYIGHLVHIHVVDDIVIGSRCTIADGVLLHSGRDIDGDRDRVEGAGAIRIGERVFIGEGAKVLGGVTIGDDAVIGAASVVTRDVPAGATVAGVPARILREQPATGEEA